MTPGVDPVAGRTAVVTGAGNGLGRAIAVDLADHGARVVLAGRRRDRLDAVAADLGGRARVAQVDTADEESVRLFADELVDEDVSVLVNNAGIAGPVAALPDVSREEWDEVFAVNVRGVFLMCRAFVPRLVSRGGGDVVNIASVSGKRPLARRTPYTASKMAVIGLTTTLAEELGTAGVRVNTLSPGPVAGERMERNFAREAAATGRTPADAEADFVSRSAMRRMVTEEEVAQAVRALLSMTGLTGADIDLSAGMFAR